MALFEPIIEELNRNEVRYIVVGGVAVVLHGHVRATGDLDLVVDLTPREAKKAIDALVRLGLRPAVPVEAADFADPNIRERWITEKGMQVFPMRDPADPWRHVDLFVDDAGFSGLWERSVVVPLGATEVRIASVEDLIAMKRDAGRLQDLADIEALEQLPRGADDG